MWYLGVKKTNTIFAMLGPLSSEKETRDYKKQVINKLDDCGYYDAIWFNYCSFRLSGNTIYEGKLNKFIDCPILTNTEALREHLYIICGL